VASDVFIAHNGAFRLCAQRADHDFEEMQK